MKEITCQQFDAFYQATRGRSFPFERRFSDQRRSAQTQISWYQAAEFCNWLSEQEGLQPCYESNDQGEFTEGMKVRADFLSRSGYRLPMSPEWEYACRADAITTRHYGHDPELLDRYAWFQVQVSGSRRVNSIAAKGPQVVVDFGQIPETPRIMRLTGPKWDFESLTVSRRTA